MTITPAFMENIHAARGSNLVTEASNISVPMPEELREGGYDLGPEFGAMVKGMVAFGRVGAPWEVASVVSFLVSEDEHWVTGLPFGVDGGLQL